MSYNNILIDKLSVIGEVIRALLVATTLKHAAGFAGKDTDASGGGC